DCPAPILRLNSIAKTFGAVRALKGVSFDLQPGEVHALLGENGAGKSTLIKIITGAHQPDSGAIEIAGESIPRLTPATARKLGIACIYQQPALFLDLTVAENIALRLGAEGAFHRVGWTENRANAAKLLRRVGASIAADTEVRRLSMPEQQLVEIACAIGAGVGIVIMDEPTASLTQKEQLLLYTVVRDLRERGVGVVYISHRLEEIFALADRVTVLRDGESVATNNVDDIDETALIKMMVGREISRVYPPSQTAPGKTVLTLRGVNCEAGGICNVSLEVRAGEVLGLAGLVGAGRTELARVIFGVTPADTGEIHLDGSPVSIGSPADAVAHGIAYLPEDRRRHGVILEMPVAANVTMVVHQKIFPGSWLRFGVERELAEGYIRELGIKASGPDAPASSLSGGNQQKVALARWLAATPQVLILDEPTQGVDIGAKVEIHKLIRRLAAHGLAVIMISSDLPEIIGMSDRIAVMRGGTIVAQLPGGSDAHAVMAAALGQKEIEGSQC
ncbi:MAG TPA: sugar ABC transporter ATP-binding protein, partial [Verrucomicrobiae bacterium]|nr:sugar ABC transporter ATP-binding protein [Verrucomicrobiae bacterium]